MLKKKCHLVKVRLHKSVFLQIRHPFRTQKTKINTDLAFSERYSALCQKKKKCQDLYAILMTGYLAVAILFDDGHNVDKSADEFLYFLRRNI